MNGIIPVIDLKRGQVVHAIAGNREKYQPIQSCLCDSSAPSAVATAFSQNGYKTVYVADLDAITSDQHNAPGYRDIQSNGLSIWLDSGVTTGSLAQQHVDDDISKVVIGLESIEHSRQISNILNAVTPENAVVSLDMKHGKVLTQNPKWKTQSAHEVASELISLGLQNMILLDLSRVGTERGTGTETLCQKVKQSRPDIHVTVGGGVANRDDVQRLLDGGADYVLVATAIHRGQI